MNLFGKHTNPAPEQSAPQAAPSDPLQGYHFTPPPQMVYPVGSPEDLAQKAQAQDVQQMVGGAMSATPPGQNGAELGAWSPPAPDNQSPLIPGSPDSG